MDNTSGGGDAMRRSRTRKQTLDPQAAALVMYRRRCLLLERQVSRLLAASPFSEQKRYIKELEQRVLDVEDRWEEAETECYDLRKLVGRQERRASA
jgi:hypothetical protein